MAVLSTPNKDETVLIVAIDFGTTYSGVSFARSDNTSRQDLVIEWPSKTGGTRGSEKVPTRIAYPTEDESPAWGYQIAETDFRYQEFKLGLDKTRKAHHSSIAQRCKEPASLTFSHFVTPTKLTIDFLKELRKCLEKSVDEPTVSGDFGLMKAEYVITVPAIWSDAAKDLTKFCAEKAGMGNVKLITEPEAAMAHVLEQMQADEYTTGDTFMICDAGGGTVDLITYKVTSLEPLQVEEVVQGDGDRCGSAYVTRLFGQYILEHYAKLPNWTEKHTAAIIEGFEAKAKRTFDDKDTEVVIKVLNARDYQKRNIKIVKQKVFIPAADVKEMFDQVCPTIFGLIKEQRRRAMMKGASITAVILVGGFSQSPYLREYLKNKIASIDKKIKIIEPKSGWSAVVRGALSRALPLLPSQQRFPQVMSRFARRFYGITDSRIFDPSTDHESKRFFVSSGGQYYVERISWFLGKGNPIRENYENRRNYAHSWNSTSTNPKDTTIYLKIVSWDSADDKAIPPIYPDAPGIEKVTDLNVDLSVIPKEDLKGVCKDDTMFYECYPDVKITYHFATIQYQLYIGDKCYGEVQSGFEV